MNLAQCLDRRGGAISFDLAHRELPAAPRGHLPAAPRIIRHEAPDLSVYATHKVGALHDRIVALIERENRRLSIDEIKKRLIMPLDKSHIMTATCYLAKIGRIERFDAERRRCTYGPRRQT